MKYLLKNFIRISFFVYRI